MVFQAPQKHNFSISLLTPDRFEDFKTLRLEALQQHRGVFGSNYELESQLTDDAWKEKLSSSTCAFFGLEHSGKFVGITGIYINPSDTSEGVLIASYIQPEYRGDGGSTLLYQARIDWARSQGLTTLTVSHRRSNEASKRANQKHGFIYSHSAMKEWPDGGREEEEVYHLTLDKR